MDAVVMSSARLLVTGAGGFCGEHAVAHFVKSGCEVIAAVSRNAVTEKGSTAVIRCDWTDPEDARRAVAESKPDAVVHLAGLNAADRSWHNPAGYLMTNAMGTVHLLEAVRSADRPCRVLIAGSMLRFQPPPPGSIPNPPHPYSLSKSMQVLIAQSWKSLYGLDVVVAEPSNLIGPGRSRGLCALLARYTAEAEAAAEAGLPSPVFRLSSRHERRDYLDVRDAIAAYDVLLRSGVSGELYPVASGRFVTNEQLAGRFEALARVPLSFEVGDSAAPSPEPVDASAVCALGWQPRIPLEQSIADTLNDARAYYASQRGGQ
ncbi:NAD-dependent epimerase/dehydratase family protein [Paenibacillus xylaniclasticus]|uniref:NAD-dependent epimerase/dehydratase family protein n=1 Tax=Paenibacillus xylaniclasticus TaxID=588083 RepID=UPI000FDA06FD|nr:MULTISPECIES: NAD-dependent epimerase/dehydratase family protein [Paenibacillus]GFN31017.1 UDP-2-acetamido-2,6-dideoxy-hexulose 4-reductase [Paenibacillus curdlanolyticus]